MPLASASGIGRHRVRRALAAGTASGSPIPMPTRCIGTPSPHPAMDAQESGATVRHLLFTLGPSFMGESDRPEQAVNPESTRL
mgnify:CR=1 FL=1